MAVPCFGRHLVCYTPTQTHEASINYLNHVDSPEAELSYNQCRDHSLRSQVHTDAFALDLVQHFRR